MSDNTPTRSLSDRIDAAVRAYDADQNVGRLLDCVRDAARDAGVEDLVRVAEPYRERLEIVIPLYEEIVRQRPHDARAIVTLANAYWLTGRGPDVVGELALRACNADPENRGAWHLWALAESDVRARVERWRDVARRFPADQLARAALADNAASLAGAEHDPLALDLAVTTYEGLLVEATSATQKRALEHTLDVLRGWKI
ncbi:MAG TPA: hypothetical protein VKH19_16955 [Gemmatimonadaceae bacterium]|nr:hypothetical protein [Gemmatimonadaceae bacterium]